jgi:hypothetical protein
MSFVPIIGMVFKNGYTESYDYKTAIINDFHHSFIMESKDLEEFDYDQALRFVKLAGEDYYTLEGEPALEPFTSGKKQINIFATHCIENGVNPDTKIKIKDHKLNTRYEGLFIGKLKDFYKTEYNNKDI